jgi:hypothetical protein
VENFGLLVSLMSGYVLIMFLLSRVHSNFLTKTRSSTVCIMIFLPICLFRKLSFNPLIGTKRIFAVKKNDRLLHWVADSSILTIVDEFGIPNKRSKAYAGMF